MEVRGHEKQPQGNVVRRERMWQLRPGGQETTPR